MIQEFVTQATKPDFRLPDHQCQVETVIPEAHWLVRLATSQSSEFQCRTVRLPPAHVCPEKRQHVYTCMYTPHMLPGVTDIVDV